LQKETDIGFALGFVGFRHAHILALYDLANKTPEVDIVAACEEDSRTDDDVAFAGSGSSEIEKIKPDVADAGNCLSIWRFLIMTDSKVTRYALVGTGGRAPMYIDPIATTYKDSNELVGLCDVNPARLAYHTRRLADELGHHEVPTYLADDFDRMIEETQPHCVIVCTIDRYHSRYIIRAMELGCDAITEKPMTIDDKKCRAIIDTIQKTGRRLRVIFNYRWGPGPTHVHKLLSEGTIGDIIHVDMEYLLNADHGADYFRRWHREKENSGGLMVHKSTHHFDLVNWWLDSVPETVFAFGRLAFYGTENAKARGIEVKYQRYTGNDTAGDPFALDLNANKTLKALYLDAEKHDGYQRDRNVFGEPIDIEDTMSVLVRYRTGTVLNYSLNAYLPREGFHVVFNGTKGRLEYRESHTAYVVTKPEDPKLPNELDVGGRLTVHPMFGQPYDVPIPQAKGGHGGADPLLQEQIFSPDPPAERDGRNAAQGQGAASILIGIAANTAFETGQPVRIADLCPQLGDAKRLGELP